eukprot:786248_1
MEETKMALKAINPDFFILGNGVHQGYYPCEDDASKSCQAPEDWYPELLQGLGEPLAAGVVNGYECTRSFKYGSVYRWMYRIVPRHRLHIQSEAPQLELQVEIWRMEAIQRLPL